jgi:hypothetical protein
MTVTRQIISIVVFIRAQLVLALGPEPSPPGFSRHDKVLILVKLHVIDQRLAVLALAEGILDHGGIEGLEVFDEFAEFIGGG